MTAKEYLGQISLIDTKIRRKQEYIEELKEAALGVGGFSYDRERVQTSHGSDRTTGIVDRYVDLERECQDEIAELMQVKKDIIDTIYSLGNPIYIDILYKMYVEDKCMREVAYEMARSYPYIRKQHTKAVKAVDELIIG